MPMKLCHVKKIERHFSSSKCSLHSHLKDLIINVHPALGSTPLLLACHYGELESVKRIIKSWGVDVRASAKYYSDPSQPNSLQTQIEAATPLFVAAFNVHNQIVRYLLDKGADVSVKTSHKDGFLNDFDGLTPLYGAVSDRCSLKRSLAQHHKVRHSVVLSLLEYGASPNADSFRPSDGRLMWMERMCGVDSIIALINHGLDFKRRDPNSGLTVLDYVVGSLTVYLSEEDKLALVKLLVEKGADFMARDNRGLTPLLAAANADYPKSTVVDYLMNRDECSGMEKIEAIELAGATILLNNKYAFLCSRNRYITKGFQYWRQAHQLRQMEIKVSGSSTEKILGRKIGRNVEWTTLAELNELEKNPEDYRIQALMVKLRIISSRCLQAARFISYQLYLFKYYSCLPNNEKNILEILHIRWGMFDQTIRRLDPFSTNVVLWDIILEDVRELVQILSTLQNRHSALFNFETIKTSLDLFLQALNPSPFTVTYAKHSTYEDTTCYFGAQFSENLFSLLKMIFCLDPEILNVYNRASLAQSLRQLGHYRLGNLLLQSCGNLKTYKSLAIVRVLLDAGANPNLDVDEVTGNAPLHIVAGMSDRKLCDAACRLLVEFGANLHRVNKGGKTALDIWIELNETEDNWNEEAHKCSTRPEWYRRVPTLLCIAARVIRIHSIPYADGATPTILYPLIELRNLR